MKQKRRMQMPQLCRQSRILSNRTGQQKSRGKLTAALRHLHNKHALLRGAWKNPCRTSQQELF